MNNKIFLLIGLTVVLFSVRLRGSEHAVHSQPYGRLAPLVLNKTNNQNQEKSNIAATKQIADSVGCFTAVYAGCSLSQAFMPATALASTVQGKKNVKGLFFAALQGFKTYQSKAVLAKTAIGEGTRKKKVEQDMNPNNFNPDNFSFPVSLTEMVGSAPLHVAALPQGKVTYSSRAKKDRDAFYAKIKKYSQERCTLS